MEVIYKEKQVATDIEFIKVINECKALLLPIVEHINLDASFNKTWNHLLKKWMTYTLQRHISML